MMRPQRLVSAILAVTLSASLVEAGEFSIIPEAVGLRGRFAETQLVVSASDAGESQARADFTRKATYASADPNVATVTPTGRVLPVANGTTKLTVTVGESTREVPVTVELIGDGPGVDYLEQVRPILVKNGCAMGACHAAQYGQGGFKLSVFGFEPIVDHAAMTREGRGRRINTISPRESLLLRKPTMQIPHAGGRRLEPNSREYELIAAWIEQGAKPSPAAERRMARLDVFPNQRNARVGEEQQLRVDAVYEDGTVRDVTAWCRYDSLDENLVTVTPDGYVRVVGTGQAPVMIRFEGEAAISDFAVPLDRTIDLADWKNQNFVDELAVAKFRELSIEPSPLCDDHTFLRRLFLDVTGTLPTPDEIAEFVASTEPNKREIWIDRLLGLADSPSRGQYNERYAAFWTLRWSDLLRNNSRDLQDIGMWAMHNWIKDQFRQNVSYDRFVRELILAKGSSFSSGPANYYLVNTSPADRGEATAQLFLGKRLMCAQCHHHPTEKYSQDDYFSFAAFFARVGTKNSQEFGLFGRERIIVLQSSGEVRHPKTGKNLPPTPLDAEAVDHPLDRRIALADWLTAADNKDFSRAVVNRYLDYLLGRGLVEPVDDMRATNPPTNVALLERLSEHLVEQKFDLKQLIRVIVSSRIYQLDSQPTSWNVADERFYSHFHVKRMSAEPLLDAIDVATGTTTKFQNLPQGTRAIEIPDAEYPDFFLNTFAKPRRTSVCDCERAPDPNLAQALHTLNGDTLANKLANKTGRIATLLKNEKPHAEIVNELYLVTLSRPARDAEIAAAEQIVAEAGSPQIGYEDLLWALLNSKDFLFNH